MFHPVGHQSPSVYWRRRLLVVGSVAVLVVLIAVTVRALTAGGGDNAAAASRTGTTTSTVATPIGSRHPPAPASSTPARASTTKTTKPSKSTTTKPAPPPVPKCALAKLAVSAAVATPDYRVGDKPVVELQVTNMGTAPCVQDLADRQIELKVYNGESRVWDSHDCEIQPGTRPSTLPAGSPIRVQVTWSGLTSQPKCAGTRQRVGAGTYTLYATLSGKPGKAAQFSIS